MGLFFHCMRVIMHSPQQPVQRLATAAPRSAPRSAPGEEEEGGIKRYRAMHSAPPTTLRALPHNCCSLPALSVFHSLSLCLSLSVFLSLSLFLFGLQCSQESEWLPMIHRWTAAHQGTALIDTWTLHNNPKQTERKPFPASWGLRGRARVRSVHTMRKHV